MKLFIRKVEAKDTHAVERLLQKSFALNRSIYRPKRDVEALQKERMKIGTRLIAELDNKIIGTVRFEEHKGHIHVIGLAVHPAHQRRGIGRSLLKEIVNMAPKLVLVSKRGFTKKSSPDDK